MLFRRQNQQRPARDERFADEMRRILNERAGVALVAGSFVWPMFILQDLRLAPERWEIMLLLRLIGSMGCIFGMAINKTAFGQRHPFGMLLALGAFLSVLKVFITPLEVVGAGALYFGGHVIIVTCLVFLPLSLAQAVAGGLVVQLGYAIPMLVFGGQIDPKAFASQNSLLFTIWLLIALSRHLDYQGRKREFVLRWKLYETRRRAEDYG